MRSSVKADKFALHSTQIKMRKLVKSTELSVKALEALNTKITDLENDKLRQNMNYKFELEAVK